MDKKIVAEIIKRGGKLTSSYHPEGDTYTIIGKHHFTISPNYKMIDIYDDYPFNKLGRAWYKDIDGLKNILDSGEIIDQRFD